LRFQQDRQAQDLLHPMHHIQTTASWPEISITTTTLDQLNKISTSNTQIATKAVLAFRTKRSVKLCALTSTNFLMQKATMTAGI
jgi:hypothetical protein